MSEPREFAKSLTQEEQLELGRYVRWLSARLKQAEGALQRLLDRDYDDLAGNPSQWSSTIAKQGLGWTFRDGKSYPPGATPSDAQTTEHRRT